MGKTAKDHLNGLLSLHLNTIHETFQVTPLSQFSLSLSLSLARSLLFFVVNLSSRLRRCWIKRLLLLSRKSHGMQWFKWGTNSQNTQLLVNSYFTSQTVILSLSSDFHTICISEPLTTKWSDNWGFNLKSPLAWTDFISLTLIRSHIYLTVVFVDTWTLGVNLRLIGTFSSQWSYSCACSSTPSSSSSSFLNQWRKFVLLSKSCIIKHENIFGDLKLLVLYP